MDLAHVVGLVVGLLVWLVLIGIVYSCCVISGQISREEEAGAREGLLAGGAAGGPAVRAAEDADRGGAGLAGADGAEVGGTGDAGR